MQNVRGVLNSAIYCDMSCMLFYFYKLLILDEMSVGYVDYVRKRNVATLVGMST